MAGSVEAGLWLADDPPPSFLRFDDGVLFAPRLSLRLDYRPGDHLLFGAVVRADRGFDPGFREGGDVRLDELRVRLRPFGDGRVNVEIGKIPTVFGSWVSEHEFFDDPFLVPPIPYGEIIGIQNRNPRAVSPAALASRLSAPGPGIFGAKQNWASTIWGPAYSPGAAISGHSAHLDYAVQIRGTGLGSQPDDWDFEDSEFSHPSVAARFGFRPDAAWNLGLSGGWGPYLREEAGGLLPPGMEIGDLPQSLLGLDVRWAHRDLVVSGECIYSRYETIFPDDLEALSYYLQVRWKLVPGLWLAGRAGHLTNFESPSPTGESIPWSANLLRAEVAIGWRITPETLLKAHYIHTTSTNDLPAPSPHFFGLGWGWRF